MENPKQKQSLEWLKQQDIKSSPDILLNFADNKPLVALQLDKHPELIQQRNEFATYIVGILKNTQSITVVAKKIEKIDINQLLNWQIKWVQQFVKQRALTLNKDITRTKHLVLIAMGDVFQQGQHNEALWELHKQLIMLKAMADYPLNRIIFIESMLLSWRVFAHAPQNRIITKRLL